ncbi:hypothetical protein [Mesobacillus zeae]|uniref:Lipoprotein n=1 Tax=Mesobacillus zeae TaxID=1917180 RepID=A0A398BEJ6_9BACI|nr:hypothetical protein [Mesobacillus zeae]RID86006.1 hypothetical protein D1970_07820 [Mesobacillus zeae]
MKSFKVYVLSIVAVVTLVLSGCNDSSNEAQQGSVTKKGDLEDSIQTLGKAQNIEMNSIENGTTLRTLTKKEDIETFIKKQRMDEWKSISTLPEGVKKQYEYIFSQENTVKLTEKEEKNRSLHRVAQLITYKDVPYVTLKVSFTELNFRVPDDAEKYLSQH